MLPPLTTGCQPHQSSVSYPFLFRHHFPPPMRGVSKFSLLFATPVSFLHHHRRTPLLRFSRTISISLIFPTPQSHLHLLPIKASSKEFHTRTNHTAVDGHFGGPFPSSHPLPEWSRLVEVVSALGYLDYSRGLSIPVKEFVSYEGLTEQFVRDAAACLSFACDRPDILGLLSRRHIEMLVENGAPFLFKSALDTERRMRSFLGSSGRSHVVESDKAETVDLMMYLVSYASNPTATGRNNSSNPELSESSVRFLLNQLVDMSCRAKESDGNAPEQYQNSGSYGQTSRFLGPKIEMKRGDWICSQCSFMNFARNLKCLECEGPRPRRQLTGGEWECPQCDFLNYGRNMVCLRCDCKRPGEALSGSANSMSVSGYNNGGYAGNDAANGEKTQRWFSDVSQQHPSSDMNNMMNNEEFPEIVSSRREVNKLVLSTRNTPLDGRLANSQNHATDGSSPRSRTSSQYGNNRGSNSGYTPFVPLPADMFTKKNRESTSKDGKEAGMKISDATSSKVHDETGIVDISNKSERLEGSLELSEKPSKEAGRYSEEKNQDEKTERWFKRVAELHDVPDLASAVSDEDFPDIMPTRKGENRFVISKKKERSLTSPAYKRQNHIEQGNNAKFVPFVPFPPDYFAKKDTQPASRTGEISSKNSTPGMNNISEVQRTETQKRDNKAAEFGDHRRSTSGSNSFGSQTNSTSNSWNTSVGPTTSQISNSEVNPSQPQENQNVRSGWTGKSLEGSAVKEVDPLDMSEEAKAERWFRRVAQIKDISELSQIPDEDFPSIMPMRKGVNRFVVSKRKTPMERRLTSPQYRKNLPVINSDPLKKENDNS